MSHKSDICIDQTQTEDDSELDINETDYGFIVTSDGQLKTFFCPLDAKSDPPKEVLKIFKVFNITNIADVLPKSVTIH
jgi:hypothetical protein